jgi:hypothetical protein
MPSHHGVGPNDGECLAGFRKQLADPTQHHSVDSQKWHPTGPAPSQNDDLLPQHKDLGFHRRARPEQIDDNPKNYSAEIQHPTEDHPILRLKPTVWNLRQEQVAAFDDFCHANDPYEEHDFGLFEVEGETIFFKIDYFDRTLTHHSPDPADPAVTERVITIMLADEY